MVEINKWRERAVVERWSREEAMAAGGQRRAAQGKVEVRGDFANTRDPTMFAAASDTAVGGVVEYKAVLPKLQHVHVRCDVGEDAYLGGRTCLCGTATGGDREAWWLCVEVAESYLWASRGCNIELHVDDGHGCGKETVIAETLGISFGED